jgi:hypothetical protein
MSEKERFESHAFNLGKIVGNLQSLEMGARLAMVKMDCKVSDQVQTQLPQVKAGDLVEFNAFTNADDLAQTLEKYNKRVLFDCRIDVKSIVHLRDAIAHGRAFGVSMKHLRLLKFARKRRADGKVHVDLAEGSRKVSICVGKRGWFIRSKASRSYSQYWQLPGLFRKNTCLRPGSLS